MKTVNHIHSLQRKPLSKLTLLLAFLALLLLVNVSASADTIYKENNPAQTTMQSWFMGGSDYTRFGYDYPWSVTWTQTGTYSNVSISADVNVCDTGSSFLTTQVGAGTTVANQIASGTFGPVSGCSNNPYPNWVTLFTGLTLGPGTYYVTLEDPYGGGWRFDSAISPVLGSGVTATGDSYGYCDPFTPCDSYAPANTGNVFDAGLRVDVEGTPVPEPSSLLLLGTGLVGLAGVIRRKLNR